MGTKANLASDTLHFSFDLEQTSTKSDEHAQTIRSFALVLLG